MTKKDVIRNLMYTYGKYGLTEQDFARMIDSGVNKCGLSLRATYNGLRMMLGNNYGENESFTVEDVMDITGGTREETLKQIEEMREEVAARGEDPDDYAMEIDKSKIMNFTIDINNDK